jgi:DNA polymerase gamma 1
MPHGKLNTWNAILLKRNKINFGNTVKGKNVLSAAGIDISGNKLNLPLSSPQAHKSTDDCIQERTVYSQSNRHKSYNLNKSNFNNRSTRCIGKGYEYRRNEVDIEMLPKSLYKQIFGNDQGPKIPVEQVARARKHLSEHELLDKKADFLPYVNLKLPSLVGKNVEEHFYNIAEAQCAPYRNLISGLLKTLPEMPTTWLKQAGWTKYEPGHEPCSVSFPPEDALVFDIEECMHAGQGPTLATAVSTTAWYSWVSDALADVLVTGEESSQTTDKKHFTPTDLINLESKRYETPLQAKVSQVPKVVIGHNVSFDRARVKEQYWLQCSATRFIDTMSLHIAVSGVTSFQKILLSAKKVDQCEENYFDVDFGDSWTDKSSLNNLNDVHKLYCGGNNLDKSSRDIFVKGSLKQVADNFNELVTYCANDVKATHEVLVAIFPMFLERFPHPATLAGMLELSIAYLPVNQSWLQYIRDSNEVHNDLEAEAKILLAKKANEACRLLHNDEYKEDPWLWDQDWSTQELKLKKETSKVKSKASGDWDEEDQNDPLAEKFHYLVKQKSLLPTRRPHLPGYPTWYRKLCPQINIYDNEEEDSWTPGPTLISSGMTIAPKLLRLTWEGYPLHKINKNGWGLIIPGRPIFGGDEDLSAVPVESIKKMAPQPPSQHSDAEISLNALGDAVEKNISKRDFYNSQKSLKDGKEPAWYQGTGVWCPEVNIPGCWFRKLPHPDGANKNVGNPMARDFISRLSEGTLKGEGDAASLLEIKNALSYWHNNRDRVTSQQVVWLGNDTLPRNVRKAMDKDIMDSTEFGAIIPQLLVFGTLTRRAVERTWLTASNAVTQRVGSELRAMIRVPAGYHLVGADVDSQVSFIV